MFADSLIERFFMRKNHQGFSTIEMVLVVVVVLLLVGLGYFFYKQKNKPTASTTKATSQTQTAVPDGTTQSIDSLTAQDAASEASIDSKYTTTEQNNAQSANSAASALGGSYNESSL
jgi:uncharacterized protein HemX